MGTQRKRSRSLCVFFRRSSKKAAAQPIPACKGTGGGAPAAGGQCDGPQFPPPAPGLYGFGNGPRGGFEFSVVDKLQVPHDLAPGEYVLSFRYDCERECSNGPWSALPRPRSSDRRSLCVARDEPGLERLRQRPHHRLSGLREVQRALGSRGANVKELSVSLLCRVAARSNSSAS